MAICGLVMYFCKNLGKRPSFGKFVIKTNCKLTYFCIKYTFWLVWIYGPTWPFLFTYGSHDMRHTDFRRLTVINGTPGNLGRHNHLIHKGKYVIFRLRYVGSVN